MPDIYTAATGPDEVYSWREIWPIAMHGYGSSPPPHHFGLVMDAMRTTGRRARLARLKLTNCPAEVTSRSSTVGSKQIRNLGTTEKQIDTIVKICQFAAPACAPFIQLHSAQRKGFSPKRSKADAHVGSAFAVGFVSTCIRSERKNVCKRLGFKTRTVLQFRKWNYLKRWVSPTPEIEGGQCLCCGTMTVRGRSLLRRTFAVCE